MAQQKVALITGVTGQDGSYLAELLLDKGYEVHGLVRPASTDNLRRVQHLVATPGFELSHGDLTDSSNLARLVGSIKPDEVYNLGAQTHVKVSFSVPEYTAEVDALGTLRLLEAVRGLDKAPRFFQASTSELFGKATEIPQRETTPFYPRSPYAAAKAYAYWIVVNYREAYGMFAVNGILFNHESPRRGEAFVSRKITRAAARIRHGQQDQLCLGNLDARRDWGYAPEYVEAVWAMLRQQDPTDLVVATGETHTVREFASAAFERVGLPVQWQGRGVDEVGVASDGRELVRIDPLLFRPTEADVLQGDATRAAETIGWRAQTHFEELVAIMVRADLEGQDVG